jgi:chromosome segregation ATPase
MNSILSLFVKEVEPKDSSKTGKTPPPVAQTAVRPPTVVVSLTGAPAIHAAAGNVPRVDPQVRAQLEKAMLSDGDNSVGKFCEAVASLVDDIPDATARIRVAFKTLKSSGLTPEAVVGDLASDERILAAKQQEFKRFIADKRQSGLGAKQTEIDSVTTTITNKHREIEELSHQIAQLEARQAELEAAARVEAQKYAEVENGFDTTLAAIRAERQQILSQVQPFCTNKQ